MNSITKDVCYDFLKEVDNENSAWTTSRHMAALNKTLEHDLNKSEGDLKQRSYKDITRSRLYREHDSSYNPDNYKEQIDFAKAFGLRRESINGGDYEVKEMSLFREDDTIYCAAIEKGGKYREARCLEEYEEIIEDRYKIDERSFYDKETYIEKYQEDNDDILFDDYTKKIDNHAFRREYAEKLYYELKEELEDEGYNVEEDYRGYNKDIVFEVSKSLGHERSDIVVEYYLN